MVSELTLAPHGGLAPRSVCEIRRRHAAHSRSISKMYSPNNEWRKQWNDGLTSMHFVQYLGF